MPQNPRKTQETQKKDHIQSGGELGPFRVRKVRFLASKPKGEACEKYFHLPPNPNHAQKLASHIQPDLHRPQHDLSGLG